MRSINKRLIPGRTTSPGILSEKQWEPHDILQFGEFHVTRDENIRVSCHRGGNNGFIVRVRQ
jgi:hypothetical protein